jgi:EAL domain-containing protein (putative c-di-GMP-specific phosphodiesterase class I)
MGVLIYMDDFGTGYSSLAQLQRMPLDALKIDRAFVKDMNQDETSRSIVESIIALAHTMRLRVIAEGVETADQAARLAASGCDYLQGYYFGKPMPVERVALFVEERAAAVRVPRAVAL